MHAREDGTARLNHTGQAGPVGSASHDVATEQLPAQADETLDTFEPDDRTATTPQILDLAEQRRTVRATWQRH
jgi:hypothetical protein